MVIIEEMKGRTREGAAAMFYEERGKIWLEAEVYSTFSYIAHLYYDRLSGKILRFVLTLFPLPEVNQRDWRERVYMLMKSLNCEKVFAPGAEGNWIDEMLRIVFHADPPRLPHRGLGEIYQECRRVTNALDQHFREEYQRRGWA